MISILGLDPGFQNFGWSGVVKEGNEASLGLCGMISHPRQAETFNVYMDEGIGMIADQFPVILSLVQPQVIYCEFVPPGKLGSRSELITAAATTAKTIAYQWGIPWIGIASSTWKKELLDDGKATKARVRNYLIDNFPSLGERHTNQKIEQKEKGEKVIGVPQDVFDAIGIALVGAKLYGEEN